jgi:DNA-binding SARP family transcriptional activator
VAAGDEPGRVSIALCGDVRVLVGGRRCERDLPGRLGRVLLAYLALNRHRAASRDELVEALWPRGAPSGAAGTLSTLLSGVRRALGPELVEGRSALRLALPEAAAVDTEQAAAAAERARAALAAGDAGRAATAAEGALDVLERTLLPGFEAPWLDECRRELDEQRLEMLELLARAALGQEDGVHRAQAAARRLVALAPFRESGHALLMEAHAARGNVAEALRTFDELRRLMREELGSVPSHDLRELHRRLLERAGDGATGAPAVPLPEPLERAARRPLVGRGRALRRLREHLAEAGAGARRFVFLAGESGIGKTSLAAAFAREASDRGGTTVLYGRADEEPLLPYQPFAEAIWHWASHGADPLAAEQLDELSRLVPQLHGRVPAAHDPPGAGPDVERYRMFEAAVAALDGAAAAGTLVLVLDDLHWADRGTLRLLRHLARAPAPERLLVVGAFRDVEMEPPLRELIADLRREHEFESLALAGLDAAETAALVEARELPPLPSGAAARLHELTGGNPLFLEELLRSVAEAGDAERALLDVPEGIKEVVGRRVARLGDSAEEVLALAAVAGQTFRVGVLEAAASVPVVPVLERALAARLLVEGHGPDELSFSHALVRETLYGGLRDVRRVRLHRLLAERLEARRGELRAQPAELARHFFQAHDLVGPAPAVRYAREAADRAAEALAWEDAAWHLERALEADAVRDPPDPSDRCELLLALGEARLREGHGAARAAFAEAAALARGRSAEQLGRAAIGYGGRYYEAGVIDRDLIELLRAALDALGEDEAELRARVLARLAEVLHFAGEPETSIALAGEAVALAGRLGDEAALGAALAGRHVALLHVSHHDARRAVSARLLERSRDPEAEMEALHARLFDLLESGDVPAARRAHERLDALARELRQPLFAHFAVGWAGTLAQLDARLDDAERLAAESYEMRTRLGAKDAETVFAAQMFLIRRLQGRVGELRPVVAEAVARSPALAPWRASLPLVLLAADEPAEARAELERQAAAVASIPRDFFWLTATALLAEAAGRLGAPQPAADLERLLAPHATRFAQVGYAGTLAPVGQLLGLLAAARGDLAAAVARLEDALARCAAAGALVHAVRIRGQLADVLARSGERERARRLRAEAAAEADRLGITAA